MASKPEPPHQAYLLKELEQLQAIADPLRLPLLELLSQKPMTVTQVASLLKEKPNRLYYHVKKLEHAGLVQLIETRPNRGILEKYYQAVAKGLTVDESLLQFQQPTKEEAGGIYQAIRAAFDSTLKDLRQTLNIKAQDAAKPSTEKKALLHGVLTRVRLPREKAKEFSKKVVALCEEFESADDTEGDIEYRLTLLWLPLTATDQNNSEESR
ncbi:MAG: helix-turn-helix domain-containing protein [Truepera sp.]|nr:helix-turn-helix domain-containing protein [Truepera sp.]